MTTFEHVMLGASISLAGGFPHRHGWRIAGMTAVAAVLPDWDAVTIVFGAAAYDQSHRIWGHNVFATGLVGGLAGAAEYRWALLGRLQRAVARRFPKFVMHTFEASGETASFAWRRLAVWISLGMLAAFSHLVTDLVYSGHPQIEHWGLALFWPFSQRTWEYPIVPWGDVGATLIFVGEMFALYRWPALAQRLACFTIVAVAAYVGVRAVIEGGTM